MKAFLTFLANIKPLIQEGKILYDDAVKLYRKNFNKDPEGIEALQLRKEFSKAAEGEKVIPIAPRLPKEAPYSEKNPSGWMSTAEEESGIMSRLKGQIDDLKEQASKYEDMSVSDFMSDYFNMPKSKTPVTDKIQKQLGDVKLFGDETFEELQIIKETGKHPRNKADGGRIKYAGGGSKRSMILDMLKRGADVDTVKEITGASDMEIEEAITFFKYGQAGVPLPTFDESGKMIDDGLYKGRETRPENKAMGGRIGYATGAGVKAYRGIKALMDSINKKFGKGTLRTAENIARPESAITRDLFKRMSKKLQNKLPKKGEFIEDGETPDYEYYAELLNDAEDSRGFNVQGDETIEVLEDRLKQLKDEEAYWYGQYKAGKLDPEPGEINRSRLDFLKRRAEDAEMSGDSRLISRDELDELDSLEKRFEYLDLEEKAQNLDRKLTKSEIERLKEINDSGYVDFQIEMDRINRNKKAEGGLSYLMGL